MNENLKPPIVTEDDVLRGSLTLSLPGRDGANRNITVTAMPWRTALGAAFSRVQDAMVHIVETCVAGTEQPALDQLTPVGLVWIASVAQQLTNGVDALKKAKAQTVAAPPASPSFLPPNAT